jgi:hypothetical protein
LYFTLFYGLAPPVAITATLDENKGNVEFSNISIQTQQELGQFFDPIIERYAVSRAAYNKQCPISAEERVVVLVLLYFCHV